ncbi:MAG TPA: winged helix-turn-helix domain-containing tetratricopeptide repeat protein [Bradyrhizobium sp.]|nr:winged helix-turn-helix domain-containing tetratricopeptide repeat protein [Bradyrhizobium sp.]
MRFMFADHTLDIDLRELKRGAIPVPVEPQVFDLLTYLVKNRDRVVTKDDLLGAIWGGRIVADSTLASRINAVRKAVGDSGEEQKLIRTIARRGIRFVGDVELRPADKRAREVTTPNGKEYSARVAIPQSERRGIAVLPFVNMSGEADQEYFSDGMSEDIIFALSKLRWFFVIARNSSFTYKGKSVHIKQIGEELGVGYVVEGSVRKEAGRVRITVQLNDVATGSHVWAERYDRELADVFAVQDEITEAIVAAIEPQLYRAEHRRARRKPPENLDAWDLVMRALVHFWRVTREDHRQAQELLEQAIAIDPNYAQALAVLAVSHTFGAHMGWESAATATPIAERAGLAAVQYDGEDPWSHLALACAHAWRGRIEDSVAAYETALRLNPNFSLALGCYGTMLSYTGRWREGAEAAHRAMRLSPREFSAIYNGVAAFAAFAEGDYCEAIRLSRELVRQYGDFVVGHRVLTAAAGMTGDTELAAQALQGLRRAQPNVSLAWVATQLPIRNEERVRYVEGLRRAGLT